MNHLRFAFATSFLTGPLVLTACGGNTPAPTCSDGQKNGAETAVDCGGACAGCALEQRCLAGTDCASGVCGVGGFCVECITADTCPGANSDCATRTCDAGVCGTSYVTAGTAVADQLAGDCQVVECDGQGATTSVADDTDVPGSAAVCMVAVCVDGSPSEVPADVRATCDGGMCDGAGACVQCVAVSDCPPPDSSYSSECAAGECTSGTCGFSYELVNTPVGNQVTGDCHRVECDGLGHAVNAVFEADVPVDNNPCTADVCTAGVPSNPNEPVRTSCGNGQLCDTGACVQCIDVSDCAAPATCHTMACAAGTCVDGFVAAGVATGPQTAGDCHKNACDGAGYLTSQIDNTDALVDGNACTRDECSAGTPQNPVDDRKPSCARTFDTAPCVDAAAALPAGTACVVTPATAGTGTALVGRVLTPLHVYEPGAVVIDGGTGQITCVGCGCLTGFTGKIVACPGGAITPGFINAHDHITYVGDKPYVATDPTVRYEHRHDWRNGDSSQSEPKIPAPGGASGDQMSWGELRFALGGATSTNGSGMVTGLLRNLDKPTGREGLPGGAVDYDVFPLADQSGTQKTTDCTYASLPTPPPATTSAYTPHVSEGINLQARNEMMCLNGERPTGVNVMLSNTAVIHGVGVGPVEVEAMASGGAKLIWSPRSNVTLYGDTAPVTLYANRGVTIALGTDWLPSGSMNVLRELACAKNLSINYLGGYFDDQALWRMVTIDAALALGAKDASGQPTLGLLAPGAYADIAMFSTQGRPGYTAVVDAKPEDLLLVMRAGKVLAGDSGVISGLTTGCEALDVCGAAKQVCLAGEAALTLAAMTASTSVNVYPLFFCAAPPDEPSCDPARVQTIDRQFGSSSYPGPALTDADHDGVDDSTDNCPGVFNPIRPVDFGDQPDFDVDGVGDACDPCPLDPSTTSCSPVDPADLDHDAVADAGDNCPGVRNPDQTDSDGDRIGDACDLCPLASNLNNAGCPASIADIKNGVWLTGDRVAVRGVVVTAVTPTGSPGYFVEVSPSSPDWDAANGEKFGGIFVYVGTGAALPAVGDGLDITGANVAVYAGQFELITPTAVPNNGLTAPAPEAVTVADVMTGGAASAYEGVLVHLTSVTVSNGTPAGGTGDTAQNEVELTGGLRVDDFAGYVLNPFPATGTVYDSLTGVVGWRNGLLKVFPRSAADVAIHPPALADFSATQVFQRLGSSGSTLPKLYVRLAYATPTARTITVTSDNTAIATVDAVVSIAAGATQGEVVVTGVGLGTVPLRASENGVDISTSLGVIAVDAAPTLVSFTPATATVSAGATQALTASLDLPSPAGGTTIGVSLTPGTSGTLSAGSIVISENAFSGTVTFTAGLSAGTEQASATLGSVTLNSTISVDVPTSVPIGGYKLIQTTSNVTYAIPAGTTIASGGYVIIARNAAKADFETAWGVTLGSNVVYINSATKIPLINGDETYTIQNPTSTVVDGPTLAQPPAASVCYGRVIPRAAASLASSWVSAPAPSAWGPGNNGTPGSGQAGATIGSGLYISEVCDFTGTNNFNYEFVELYYAGGAVP